MTWIRVRNPRNIGKQSLSSPFVMECNGFPMGKSKITVNKPRCACYQLHLYPFILDVPEHVSWYFHWIPLIFRWCSEITRPRLFSASLPGSSLGATKLLQPPSTAMAQVTAEQQRETAQDGDGRPHHDTWDQRWWMQHGKNPWLKSKEINGNKKGSNWCSWDGHWRNQKHFFLWSYVCHYKVYII